MNLTLPLSDKLSLIHAPDIGQGKTAAMAKGLFLSCQNEIYAGESAGFGVPVWKTKGHTIFPSPVSVRWCNPNTIEKVYRLDQKVTWQIFGIDTPRMFPEVMEKVAERYMRHSALQQGLLNIRNVLFAVFRIRNSMTPGPSQGECRILYTTKRQRLIVTIEGRTLKGVGELILLNEVAGLPFSRLRMGTRTLEGKDIPAWQPCPFDTVLENPFNRFGFSLTRPAHAKLSHARLAVGREIGQGLNWAGLALTANQREFSYGINFKRFSFDDG